VADRPESPGGGGDVLRVLARATVAAWPMAIAILIALVVGDLLVLSVGQAPASVYRLLLEGTWGNAYGLGQVLYRATTLMFTGMSVALAFKGGMFNIGAEGQLAAGGFAAGLVGMALPAWFSPIAATALACAAAASAGGAVAVVPGVLRARLGVHEVIVTIMLNFVVLAILNWVVTAHLHVPETLHLAPVRVGIVPRLSAIIPALAGSAANCTLGLAIVTAALVRWAVRRTRAGFEMRAVGLASEAARLAGMDVARIRMWTFVASGMLAGLGGVNFVLGYKHYYEDGFAAGAGFLGIAVAVAGGSHPFGVVIAALGFATLAQGGLAIHAVVPKQIADILAAVTMLAVVAATRQTRALLTEGLERWTSRRETTSGSTTGQAA